MEGRVGALSYTWLGHATFLFRSPGGRRILVEPWVASNPACPESAKTIGALDLILITHGHSDHAGDAVSIARATGAHVIANYEVCLWLEAQGIRNTAPMGHGGTQTIGAIAITMVNAVHGSSVVEEERVRSLGQAAGYVIRFEDGVTIYFAGDTDVFGDMRLIGERYRPDVAFLPIGDRFTMGPDGAAAACDLLGVKQVVPMHFGTFPFLTGTPGRLRELVEPRVRVVELKPGETAQ
jgi:L-ascorbate metabolism protein UlaG (beta-lactamase superfamily)